MSSCIQTGMVLSDIQPPCTFKRKEGMQRTLEICALRMSNRWTDSVALVITFDLICINCNAHPRIVVIGAATCGMRDGPKMCNNDFAVVSAWGEQNFVEIMIRD